MMAGEIVRGAVGVVRRDGRYLMIRRAEGLLAGGAWCFPGGAIEDGESACQAMVREMHEEVGLIVEAGACLWRWRRDDGELELEFWEARITGGELRPNPAEVQDVRWMSADEIRRLDGALPNLLRFLEEGVEERKGRRDEGT